MNCLLFSAVVAGHTSLTNTSVQTVHRGASVNISCRYKPSDETVSFDVKLENNYSNYILCSVKIMNNSLISQSCKYNVRLIWILNGISFEVSYLQINDTGTYKCVQTRTIPPPSVVLRDDRTFVQVIARPTVSVSQTRALDGFTILCSSEEFYPSAIEQVWMRNGEFQNISQTLNINKTNPDGSFTLHSYLNTSDCENYSCWVNHSTLSQPTSLHVLPNYCNKDQVDVWIAVATSALLILAVLILTVTCERYRRAHHRSPVQSDTPTYVQNEIYSSLGNHHPVPCSPVRLNASQHQGFSL
nr:uncharacterized protein LOC103911752 isoform X1 [Danio rerio]XP_021335057.1 uncharacterized protein LOC103911752 isoform X1 [Danio rerio]|eukprot:XP_021335056.1 uncharacterized protein LOC103911752 isoform X1 [Danio rerio]